MEYVVCKITIESLRILMLEQPKYSDCAIIANALLKAPYKEGETWYLLRKAVKQTKPIVPEYFVMNQQTLETCYTWPDTTPMDLYFNVEPRLDYNGT